MCGIAGFSLSNDENKRTNSRRLAKELLLQIEYRGLDATGFAYPMPSGAVRVCKKDVRAAHFMKHRLTLPRRTQTAILHTRAWTQGEPSDNRNNHPIQAGPIVGVHNGWLYNDFGLFAHTIQAPRIAEVDSEAVFALLAEQGPMAALELLDGPVAAAWYDHRLPVGTLNLARGSSSPLFVGHTSGGSVVFASTEQAVILACRSVHLELLSVQEVAEGTFLQVQAGQVFGIQDFKPLVHINPWKKAMSVGSWSPNARDRAVDEWFALYDDIEEDLDELADELHANLAVGDWVQAVVRGRTAWCEVVGLPDTFPEGDYTLAAYLDNEPRELLVRRRGDEFISDPSAETTTPSSAWSYR